MHNTRFVELAFHNPLANVWRFIDTSTARAVGPVYRTKSELLADLTRYAKEAWGLE